MQLPVTFDRDFFVFRYLVSHSELALRSVEGDADDRIEIKFYSVFGMKLKTKYRSPELGYADDAQRREMLELTGLEGANAARVHVMALRSGDGEGLVACVGFTVYSHPNAPSADAYVSGDPVLIASHRTAAPGSGPGAAGLSGSTRS
ncbi:hypothetical protein [Amycolatopsis rifamycinica]|uniref:Uncharacterized protein n=1 Tax=Amycolatopsis rifamycinica TaxID=287986 RepID=A0A066TR10_9PSEU|nr:hypothetical protein [Amycolatopsis rifamycinica]KDN17586.1 hypothetical protein DV20_35245 [Amycolatopsis rifamycinica]